jgi:2-keto-3-deoxy-L-fuconate dehydrogenase
MFDLSGKTAIVTGGGKGIGAAISKALAGAGAYVAVLDIDDESGIHVAEQITLDGFKAAYYHCNIANEAVVSGVFQNVYALNNRLDILVNNAGISHIGDVLTTTEADFDRIFQVNVKSLFFCVQKAIPFLQASKGGSIINMSSIAAVVGLGQRFAYTMSKGAVYSMTFSIAKDYIKDNIRCNAIGPGRVHTPFVDNYLAHNYPGQEAEMFARLSKTQPIGRMGTPDEIAAMVLYLASDEAAFVTGSFYPIDGGFQHLNTGG